jgi:hypothetical protein
MLALVAAAVGLLAAALPSGAAAAPKQTRYSLAGGCYSLAPTSTGKPIGAASTLRFQATRLGSYLLYGAARDFVAASGDGVIRAAAPSPDSDWTVEQTAAGSFTFSPASAPDRVLAASGDALTLVPSAGAGAASQFAAVPVTGCPVYPEAQLDVKGKPAKGKTSYGEVRGLIDGHMHWMNFEYLGGDFHCGRPWSPYGIPYALPDCSEIEGPQGDAAPIQNFLNYGSPVAPHDTTGWPKLTEWRRDNLTYEGTYYRWLQRTFRAGERMIVMPVNDNRELCQLMTKTRNPCDEMAVLHQEFDDIYKLQDYVDAQAGGPGKGFFQIVKNPFQARRVINQGKMAVVLEVEVSELFNCIGADPSSCSRQTVDEGLKDLHNIGVRSSLLLNKFDNPLTGVRFDSGPIGVLINAANRASYGSFWDAETCKGPEHDNTIESGVPDASSPINAVLAQLGVGAGTLPAYPPAPHCNTRGLTALGKYTVRRMMDMHMIVNPDHMSQKAVDETLSLLEARHYSGVISPHGWMDPRDWPRIWQLGGMAFPNAGTAATFVDAWRTYRPVSTPQFFGWGYGADLGGLAEQGAPPADGDPNITYPFKSLDGRMTINRQQTGDRVFDYNQDGVATYGQYAEWYQEVGETGGNQLVRDMRRGSEAYLQMWERAVGIPAGHCMAATRHLTRNGIGRLRLGLHSAKLLRRAGQPLRRKRAWSYCVRGKSNKHAGQTAVLTPGGKVVMVASSAKSQRTALGVGPGAPVDRLDKLATRVGPGLWTHRVGGRTFLFVVRGGVVRTVAVADGAAARSNATLRAYLKLIPRKAPSRRPPKVVTTAASQVAPSRAISLAAADGAQQFPFFCGIQPAGTL